MKKKIAAGVLVAVLVIGAACGIYVNDYYRPEEAALACLAQPGEGIVIKEYEDKIVFMPEEDMSAAMIFYPGGKVGFQAYAPLMEACCQVGVGCVLVKMPANLAVLDKDAAGEVRDNAEELLGVTELDWYIGGHSLGGAMAAAHVADCDDEYEGLVLLAAYSTADLRESGLNVLSMYGSEDLVLDMEKYEEYASNLPADATEVVIEGGCHAYFGAYGEQEGDGEATIEPALQIAETAAAIGELAG